MLKPKSRAIRLRAPDTGTDAGTWPWPWPCPWPCSPTALSAEVGLGISKGVDDFLGSEAVIACEEDWSLVMVLLVLLAAADDSGGGARRDGISGCRTELEVGVMLGLAEGLAMFLEAPEAAFKSLFGTRSGEEAAADS